MRVPRPCQLYVAPAGDTNVPSRYMPTALLLCCDDDAVLMPAVVDELKTVGIASYTDAGDLAADDGYDVACIFWCCHAATAPFFKDRCRRALQHAQRSVLIQLDGTPPPQFAVNAASVVLSEPSLHGRGGADVGLNEWCHDVKAIIPDIQFDTRGVRQFAREAVTSLKHWLRPYKEEPPDICPSWTAIREAFSGAVTFASLIAAFVGLGQFFRDHLLVLLLLYIVSLIVWSLWAFPMLVGLLEWAFGLRWDSFDDHWPWVALGGSVFAVVWMVCVLFADGWFPLRALLLAWALIFTAMFALQLAGALATRGLYYLAILFPATPRAFFISYPVEVKSFVGMLEGELTRQQIAFYDGWALRRKAGTKYSQGRLRRRVKSAVRDSGFVVTFISNEYLNSQWCSFELSTVASLKRPTLGVLFSALSVENRTRVPERHVSLIHRARRALDILVRRADPYSRRTREDQLAELLWSELRTFLGHVCSHCHGHGTDSSFRTRLVPSALRFQCRYCFGSGLRRGPA
jgi:hypothetical protein